jgi:hypothetical protein
MAGDYDKYIAVDGGMLPTEQSLIQIVTNERRSNTNSDMNTNVQIANVSVAVSSSAAPPSLQMPGPLVNQPASFSWFGELPYELRTKIVS